MKKKLITLVLVSTASLVIWGCNSGGSSVSTQPAEETEEIETTLAESETPLETETMDPEDLGETQPNGGMPEEYSFNAEVVLVQEGELRVKLLEDCGADLKADDEVVVFFNNGDFNEGDTVYVEFNGMLMSEENVRLAATVLYVTE